MLEHRFFNKLLEGARVTLYPSLAADDPEARLLPAPRP